MSARFAAVAAVVALTVSCTRHARTERMMTWSENAEFAGMTLPPGEYVIVLRFVDDSGQGLIEEWSPELRDRLSNLGNPVRVTFDCWRQVDGTFGFNIVALGGVPYMPAVHQGPSRAGVFSEGPTRPNPLESAVPR